MSVAIRLFIFTFIFTAQGQAIDERYIDELEGNVDRLYLKVDGLATIILSSEERNALEILNRYDNPKAKLIQQWLFIAGQRKSDSDPISRFINDSRRQIASYLGQLQFASDKALRDEDYYAIKKQIRKIIDRSKRHPETLLNHTYFAKTGINIRKLPIVSDLTKQRSDKGIIVLNKRDFFKLLYGIEYQTNDNNTTRWGYIETEKDNRHGWINLGYAYRVE